MFGDTILVIKQWWKQFWCIHDYRPNFYCDFRYRQCTKCGRVEK